MVEEGTEMEEKRKPALIEVEKLCLFFMLPGNRRLDCARHVSIILSFPQTSLMKLVLFA